MSSGRETSVVSDIIPTSAAHIASSGAIRFDDEPEVRPSAAPSPSSLGTDRHSPSSPRMKYVIDEQSGCEHGSAMKSSGTDPIRWSARRAGAASRSSSTRRIGSIGFVRPDPNIGWNATPAM